MEYPKEYQEEIKKFYKFDDEPKDISEEDLNLRELGKRILQRFLDTYDIDLIEAINLEANKTFTPEEIITAYETNDFFSLYQAAKHCLEARNLAKKGMEIRKNNEAKERIRIPMDTNNQTKE